MRPKVLREYSLPFGEGSPEASEIRFGFWPEKLKIWIAYINVMDLPSFSSFSLSLLVLAHGLDPTTLLDALSTLSSMAV